jgi:hypothetical protein
MDDGTRFDGKLAAIDDFTAYDLANDRSRLYARQRATACDEHGLTHR